MANVTAAQQARIMGYLHGLEYGHLTIVVAGGKIKKISREEVLAGPDLEAGEPAQDATDQTGNQTRRG